MKIAIASLMALAAAGSGVVALVDAPKAVASTVQEQQDVRQDADADKLYDLVKQARVDLCEMRMSAGLSACAVGRQAGQLESHESGEGLSEHGGREGRGEGGELGGRERGGRGEVGEEGGAYLPKMTNQNELFANGARLVLRFNPSTQVFVGSVTNTTANTLSQVRVEVHLDNGTELGPTKRIDVQPGRTIPVELGAFGNEFTSWISHPEAGVEQGHGQAGEEGGEGRGERGDAEGRGEHGGGEGRGEHGGGEGRGEHGGEARGGEARGVEGGESGEPGGRDSGGEGARPLAQAYRPLHNQLQVLRGEMHAFQLELKQQSTGGRP